MDWALYQPAIRFDIRAERAEYQRLFHHQARVLQDRLARRGHTNRTQQIPVIAWEKLYQAQARERRLLYQARVLSWGKEKRYYLAHKPD